MAKQNSIHLTSNRPCSVASIGCTVYTLKNTHSQVTTQPTVQCGKRSLHTLQERTDTASDCTLLELVGLRRRDTLPVCLKFRESVDTPGRIDLTTLSHSSRQVHYLEKEKMV